MAYDMSRCSTDAGDIEVLESGATVGMVNENDLELKETTDKRGANYRFNPLFLAKSQEASSQNLYRNETGMSEGVFRTSSSDSADFGLNTQSSVQPGLDMDGGLDGNPLYGMPLPPSPRPAEPAADRPHMTVARGNQRMRMSFDEPDVEDPHEREA